MKEIGIKIAPFVLKQTVFIREVSEIGDDNVTTVSMPWNEIPKFISLQTDLDKVYLFGSQKFAKKIQEDCLVKYNVKNVTFVINP